jgi:glucosamine--fructose-6-phosphate aminotransferase (isomerizing)
VSALADAIARQADAVAAIAGREPPPQVATLAAAQRILLVGTGTSFHAAELGAAMFRSAGRVAVPVSSQQFAHRGWPVGPGDVLVVLTHTGHTAYAQRALADAAELGLPVVAVTGRGAGVPGAIETVETERSQTYTISYLAALAVLARLADGLGVPGTSPDHLRAAAADVARTAAEPVTTPPPARSVAVIGAGLAEVTAREGALKLREAGRAIAAGFDPELFLHGSAVPYGPADLVVGIGDDPDGLLGGLLAAAWAEGVPTLRLTARGAGGHPALDQFALTAALQRLAAHFAEAKALDPDTVITGAWNTDTLWRLGAPAQPGTPP